jgi:beta-hydroxylase
MSPDQEFLSDDDRWKFFFLKCVNIRFKKNCALMPETMKVIDRCPEIIAAYLSILAPGKTLPPHEGPWSGVLRAHLGVIVPKAKSLPHNPHIIVDGQRYDWSEGKVVYFDDTYTHEAHNPTDGIRVVLFLDVIRPMSPPWSWINRFIRVSSGYSLTFGFHISVTKNGRRSFMANLSPQEAAKYLRL